MRLWNEARVATSRTLHVVVIEMTGEQQRIVDTLRALDYECTGMDGSEIDPRNWPANVLAARGRRLRVPPRSELRQ